MVKFIRDYLDDHGFTLFDAPIFTPNAVEVYVSRLRGKLDVPKERFTSVPGGTTDDDPTLLVGWAGWDLAPCPRT